MILHLKKLLLLLLLLFFVWYFSFFCNQLGYGLYISNESLFKLFIFLFFVFGIGESILNKYFLKKTINIEKEIYLLKINDYKTNKTKKRKSKFSFVRNIQLILVYFSTFYELFMGFFKKSIWSEMIVSTVMGILIINSALKQEQLQNDILVLSIIWLILNIFLKIQTKYTIIGLLFFIFSCALFFVLGDQIVAERSAVWFNMFLIISAIKTTREAMKENQNNSVNDLN